MKYFICVFFLLLLNCKQEKNELNENDIIGVVHKSNNIVNNVTDNYYILDNRFKNPGKHSLEMTSNDITTIKKKIIEEGIDKLDSNLKFVKSCKKVCLSEITIKYKSGKVQHFIFDNYLYKSQINNRVYKKIASLEEVIAEIIMKKKIDPESANVNI
ncbi:hypothetical protein [Chryseobacterium vrystaatense]|uniref:Uncharacterized protein n=1 Tax=Chryseobacterium vrystaatense TaxID=307480 RepID=A0A1M4VXD4_9FLAO|nr:hypothetical protein [Chryseobacterium vrystaatense]SHE73609.1 hypothetical protein SAMN02787073_1008 [Chryseobacterium vrystaatense]